MGTWPKFHQRNAVIFSSQLPEFTNFLINSFQTRSLYFPTSSNFLQYTDQNFENTKKALYYFNCLNFDLHLLIVCETAQAEKDLLSSEPADPAGNDVGYQMDCDDSDYPPGYAQVPHWLQIHEIPSPAHEVM